MQKRFIQQRLLEQREIETERQILETERIRKEREEVASFLNINHFLHMIKNDLTMSGHYPIFLQKAVKILIWRQK